MKIVHGQIPDATLTIAGGGKYYFDTAPYRSLPYIDIRNRYIGMHELAQLITDCDVVCCPYTDATQSGVVLSAFALNKPVIATNVGGMANYIEEGKTGMLVPSKNTNALANAIIDSLRNRNKLLEMSSNINEKKTLSETSWITIAKNYIGYYKSIKR